MTKLHRLPGGGTSASGDVIFVHGLGGHPLTTWGLDAIPSWSTWLSTDRPDLNLWSLEYDIAPTAWTGSAMPLADRATNVLAMLSASGIGTRPVCFIAHSMGGLLVKQLMRHASSVAKEYVDISRATRAIVFFSTPHSGSEVATLTSYLRLLRPTIAIEELRAHEPGLRELNLWFRNNASDLDIVPKVFYETHQTHGVTVVNATSADPGISGVTPVPLDADHFGICVPSSSNDLRYLQTLQLVNRRLPTGTDGIASSPTRLSLLRQRLLLASSKHELRSLLYETEGYLAENSTDVEALVLRDEIRSALQPRYTPVPTQTHPERWHYEKRGTHWTGGKAILGVLGVLVGVLYYLLTH